MKISRLFGSARKRIAAGAIVALALAFPVATAAASTVQIEADTTVANATKSAGTMQWGANTTASYNEVVAVQVVYNNKEAADSGKVANNLRVKIAIPNKAGANQTITTTTSADNSNKVIGSTSVTLNRADAYLQYIPGTATWKHASTANGPMVVTQKVSDDVVMGANGLVLENENPCQAGSIVVQARVMVPGVSIDKTVRVKGDKTWDTSITAKPGDTVEYKIAYKNTGNTDENAVVIGDKLPNGVTYSTGTTLLVNAGAPNGKSVSDGVTTTGIVIGTYIPDGNAYVYFEAKLPTEDKLACGNNLLRNIATAQPQGMNYYYNTADVNITKECAETPVYSCDLVTITKGEDRKVTASVAYTAKNGASFKTATFDWGNGTTPFTTSNTTASYQYSKDGTYTITAKLLMSVNGKDTAVNGEGCAKQVTFSTTTPPTTPPTELPNTGAGSVVGVIAGVSAVSALAYRLVLSRKLARR